jgi:C_GCAxxG_C_C family probable redox protein
MVSGFGKGIAGNGETCGALLTGISFISKFAYENGYNKKEIRNFCNEFYQKFYQEFPSVKCSELSGHNCDEPFTSDFDLHTCGKYLSFTMREILNFKKSIKKNNL